MPTSAPCLEERWCVSADWTPIPVRGGWQPGVHGMHSSTRHGLLLQGDPSAELLLEDLPDGFARLLVHGLAQYHGLQSTTCLSAGQKAVLLQCKQATSSSSSTGGPSSREQEAAAAAAQQQPPRQEQLLEVEGAAEAAGTEAGDAAAWGLLHALDVTCTDIVMALRELGDTLNHHSLGEYIQSSVCMRVEAAGVVV